MTDFDRVKAELKAGAFLRRYLEETGREILQGGQLKCPNAGAHSHGDANPSAHFYEDAGGARVKCFGCGGSWDLFALYRLDNPGASFMDAVKDLASRFSLVLPGNDGRKCPRRSATSAAPCAPAPTVETPEPVRTAAADEYLAACVARLEDPAAVEYLGRRGVSLATAKRLGCGFDPVCFFPSIHEKRPAIVFPASGGWAARSLVEKAHAFERGARGSAFNLEAIETTDATSAVFVVEGQFDALSVEEVGGHAVALGGMQHVDELLAFVRKRSPGCPFVVALDRETNETTARNVARAKGKLVEGLRTVGAFVFDVGTDDVFDAHDANDALLADRAKFTDRVKSLAWEASEAFVLRGDEDPAEKPGKWSPYVRTFAELPAPLPEESNPDALFANGYLRRGQVLTLVSCAGVGKSVLINQLAIAWAAGEACFLPEPIRPLSVLVFQFEDDETDMREFLEDYRIGFARLGWSEEKIAAALARVEFVDVRKLRRETGNALADDVFARTLADMQRERCRDVVILNPLTSALAEYDLSDNHDANKFFRQVLGPVVEDPETACALVIVHHTGKVPKDAKSREGFMRGTFAQYDAQGAAALMNWTRASLMVAPTEKASDFVLVGAKRQARLGWRDAEGGKTCERPISYSPDIKFWIDTPPERLAARQADGKGKGYAVDPKVDAAAGAARLREVPEKITATGARSILAKILGTSRGNAAWDLIRAAPQVYGLGRRKEGKTEYYFKAVAVTAELPDMPSTEGADE